MLTFLLAASIGLGVPDAKLVAVVAAHVSDPRIAPVAVDEAKAFAPPEVRPLSETFGRSLLPEVDLLPVYRELPPHFRNRT